MEKKVCFTSFVYGWYQDFIPVFILSVLKSYPQHFVRIFVHEELVEANKINLQLLKEKFPNSFDVIENVKEFDSCGIPHKAAYRFIMSRDYFPEFEYIYFSDIDFIIYNKFNDNFYETYLQHCGETGLPFSNSWNYDWGKYRMFGLHFVVKTPYFDIMDKWIKIMKGQNKFKRHVLYDVEKPTYDEEMLFYMLAHEFNLSSVINYGRKFPGVHLADFRTKEIYEPMLITRRDYETRIHPEHLERERIVKEKIDLTIKTDLFAKIFNNMSEKGRYTLGNYCEYAKHNLPALGLNKV